MAETTDINEFLLDIEGYEGPIDLLLTLARDQKVDLGKISILELALAYLDFIDRARDLRIELAADYLVMAAWLAFLKSKLLLPNEQEEEEELSGEALAEALAFQLRRLSALQDAAMRLFDRPMPGRDVFYRGYVGDVARTRVEIDWQCSLHDLLHSYGEMSRRSAPDTAYQVKEYKLFSLSDAIERLGRILGLGRALKGKEEEGWRHIAAFLPEEMRQQGSDPLSSRSAIAAMFGASLELAKSGRADIRQEAPFAPIYLRPKSGASPMPANDEREGEE